MRVEPTLHRGTGSMNLKDTLSVLRLSDAMQAGKLDKVVATSPEKGSKRQANRCKIGFLKLSYLPFFSMAFAKDSGQLSTKKLKQKINRPPGTIWS